MRGDWRLVGLVERHNERIEVKIEKTREICGASEEKDTNDEEQRAFEALRGWLEEWRGCCDVCHFLPTVPACSHNMDGCESVLSQHLRPLS